MLCVGGAANVRAQAFEVQQLLLDVEKLSQLKSILSDLKKGYQIVLGGYTTIKNISEGSFHLHDLFLDRLLEVSPVVKNYRRVSDIISLQLAIVREYKAAFRQFSESGLFTPEEIDYISKVYAGLFERSVKNLEDLAMVITAGKLRMSDDERLSQIDAVWKNMEDGLTFLRHLNSETKVLALQRAKERSDVATQKRLYSINN
jgi:hypothetical protein